MYQVSGLLFTLCAFIRNEKQFVLLLDREFEGKRQLPSREHHGVSAEHRPDGAGRKSGRGRRRRNHKDRQFPGKHLSILLFNKLQSQ